MVGVWSTRYCVDVLYLGSVDITVGGFMIRIHCDGCSIATFGIITSEIGNYAGNSEVGLDVKQFSSFRYQRTDRFQFRSVELPHSIEYGCTMHRKTLVNLGTPQRQVCT